MVCHENSEPAVIGGIQATRAALVGGPLNGVRFVADEPESPS